MIGANMLLGYTTLRYLVLCDLKDTEKEGDAENKQS